MWDIVLINKTDDNKYIVMTPNGDYHCIDQETFNTFKRKNKVNYEPEKIKK